MKWKEEAKRLYFVEHKKITEIAEMVGKTRKTISTFLSTQKSFEKEKERRKTENKEKRTQYKKDWEKNRRSERSFIEAACLKRQHEIDVMVLSSERY